MSAKIRLYEDGPHGGTRYTAEGLALAHRMAKNFAKTMDSMEKFDTVDVLRILKSELMVAGIGRLTYGQIRRFQEEDKFL